MALAAASLLLSVYLTIEASSASNPVFIYRVALLLLFFAISTVSALIFNAKASLHGNFGGMVLAIGGPAVLWIVALVIFTRFYPEDGIRVATLQSMVLHDWDSQVESGWRDYRGWKADIGDSFRDILGVKEVETLKNLFWNVYYDPPGSRLANVRIGKVFLYLGPKYTIKFERIRATRDSASEAPFVLNYGGQASNDTGTSYSVLLVGSDNGSTLTLKDVPHNDASTEQRFETTDIDCLIVTWYDDEVTRDGDYITADMKEFANDHHAEFRLGIAAFKPQAEPTSYQLKSRVVSESDRYLPLAFLPMRRIWSNNLEAVRNDLRVWLLLLDKEMEPGGRITGKKRQDLEAILKKAGDSVGHSVKAQDLLANGLYKSQWSADMPRAEDVVLTLFRWQ